MSYPSTTSMSFLDSTSFPLFFFCCSFNLHHYNETILLVAFINEVIVFISFFIDDPSKLHSKTDCCIQTHLDISLIFSTHFLISFHIIESIFFSLHFLLFILSHISSELIVFCVCYHNFRIHFWCEYRVTTTHTDNSSREK